MRVPTLFPLLAASLLAGVSSSSAAVLFSDTFDRANSTDLNASAHMLAAACAVTWSSYSVLSRIFGAVPTASVAVFCLASAALSLPLHLLLEQPVWPQTPLAWGCAFMLGLGPVGLAFYVWDIGVKQGDIQLLGTASYAAPLLSTIVLVLAGVAQATWSLGLAAALITAGALLAARASLRKRA